MNAQPRGISAATLAAAREVQQRRRADADELQRLREENTELKATISRLVGSGHLHVGSAGERWRISLTAGELGELHALVQP